MRTRAHAYLAVAILAPAPPVMATGRVSSRPFPTVPADIETIVALGVGLVILVALAGFLLRLIYLRSRALLADARLSLAEKNSLIATVPAPPRNGAAAVSTSEIENMLASGFPEIAPELRAALARAMVAAVKDKRGW
jgi:hypothetical protein